MTAHHRDGYEAWEVLVSSSCTCCLQAPDVTHKFGFIIAAVGWHQSMSVCSFTRSFVLFLLYFLCPPKTLHFGELCVVFFLVLFIFPFHFLFRQFCNSQSSWIIWFLSFQCNAKNIRLIVMNNLLPSSIKMHQRYDLKGSTYKRKVRKHHMSQIIACIYLTK